MKSRSFVLALCAFLLCTAAFAQNQMTDEQVLDYITQGIAEGKPQNQIIQELSLLGVSREQAERARRLHARQNPGGETSNVQNSTVNGNPNGGVPMTAMTDVEEPEAARRVYGRSVFRSGDLTFSPGRNLATPRNYRLGPGDEVIIEVYGASQQTIQQVISPEGSISVPYLGPVYLNGLTMDEAQATLKKKLAGIYSGLNYGGQTQIQLRLGRVRSIGITVVGDVRHPGNFMVSPFATVFHALYLAGGVVEPGSLRNITITRNGKVVGTADVYDFLMNGSSEGNFRLEEGDVILVVPYRNMVKIEGMVKRPMYFEMKDGETLAKLIEYAGGFAYGAHTDNVSVIRQNGKTYEVRTVEAKDYPNFVMQDGDEVEVNQLTSRFENRLTVTGAVYFPGQYELGEVRTVRDLVNKAGGPLPEAFLNRAVINREHEDRTREVIAINLGRVMAGDDPDPVLKNNDELFISSEYEIANRSTVSIAGMVSNPRTFPYAENMTIEDLIVMAGGLRNGASLARVDVTRRKMDAAATQSTKEIAELYSFSIKDGLIADGEGGFVLEPFDQVVVHASPVFLERANYVVSGEVNFPGNFSMTEREERLSDAIRKAGGVSETGYLPGARLFRTMDESERRQARDATKALRSVADSTDVDLDALTIETTYLVAIDLAKAIADPGGPEDIVLREGDRIEVPLLNNTVRVTGAVNAPGVFSYVAGKKARDYIDLCGGYGNRPYKSRAYIINLNGNKKKMTPFTKIQPGDEIVIPQKEKKVIDRSTVLAYTSAASTLTTITLAIVSIINNSKSSK